MTTRSDMLAAGLRVSTGRRCSVEKVARLAAEGELVRVDLGALARYTRQSVAAYEQRQAAGIEPGSTAAEDIREARRKP